MSLMRGLLFGASALGFAATMAAPASATPGFEIILTDLTTPATTTMFANGTSTVPVGGIGGIPFGGYTFGLLLDSNYPGVAAAGTLSSQLTFTSSAVGSNDHITVRVFLADSATQTVPLMFTAPVGPIAFLSSSTSVSFNSTLSAISYTGTDSVTVPGPTTTTLTTGPVTTSSSSQNGSMAIGGGISTTYSLNTFMDIAGLVASASMSSITLQNTTGVIAGVPEPATMAILGTGIAVLGAARRRKR
jgi:hypothetical protein